MIIIGLVLCLIAVGVALKRKRRRYRQAIIIAAAGILIGIALVAKPYLTATLCGDVANQCVDSGATLGYGLLAALVTALAGIISIFTAELP